MADTGTTDTTTTTTTSTTTTHTGSLNSLTGLSENLDTVGTNFTVVNQVFGDIGLSFIIQLLIPGKGRGRGLW